MAPTGTNLYGKHYHPFMDVAAEPLTTFKTPKWLVQGIRDAFQAHRRIAEECGLLHGDISAGNILVTQDGRGVLTDWDISGSVNDKDIARRGTWLFMSSRILQDQERIHDAQDDMESFVHVLIYVALAHIPHTFISSAMHPTLSDLINDIFFEASRRQSGTYIGGRLKSLSFYDRWVPRQVVFHCEPVQRLVRKLVHFCCDWLVYCRNTKTPTSSSTQSKRGVTERRNPRSPVALDQVDFKDHESMDDLLTSVVALPDERWSEENQQRKRKSKSQENLLEREDNQRANIPVFKITSGRTD